MHSLQCSTGAFLGVFPSQDPREVLPEEDAKDGSVTTARPFHPASSSAVSSASSTSPLRALLVLPAQRLAAAFGDGTVRVFYRAPGQHKELATFVRPGTISASCLAFDIGRQALFVGFSDGLIRAYNLDSATMVLFSMAGC